MISTGWKPNGPEREPRLGAVHLVPSRARARAIMSRNATPSSAGHEPPPRVVRHPAGDEQRDGAEHRPQRLPAEVRPARAVDEQRRDRRGRQHHDEAEHREDGDDRDEQVVVDRRRRPVGPAGATRLGRRPVEAGWRALALLGPRPAPAALAGPHGRGRGRSLGLPPTRPARARPGRSRRPARRSPRTSRSWRSRATAARRRPARPARSAAATASSIEPAIDDRADRRRRRATTSGAASPMATTARMRSGSPAMARRSRPLLRPPATSTTRSKARIAVEGGVRRRRLRVVVERHAASLGDERDAVGDPLERSPAPRPRPRRWPRRASSTVAAAASVLVRSCGSRRRRSATATSGPPGPTRRPLGDVVVGSAPAPNVTWRPGARPASCSTSASSAKPMATSSAVWCSQMRALAAA